MSQLALGAVADVSQRHISFIETGRSTPSRELVRHLGAVLDVPLREQNVMLAAAGYAPTHPETDPAALLELMPSLQFVVDAHAPYMAVVVDRTWNVVAANGPARSFAGALLDPTAVAADGVLNLMRATFHPEGLQRFITNWDVVGRILLSGLERDAARFPGDACQAALLEEVREDSPTGVAPLESAGALLVPLHYEIGQYRFELFTTIATIDAPLDVTVSELRIETFWPADQASADAWRQFLGAQSEIDRIEPTPV